MKKINMKTILLAVALCLLPMIAGAVFYGRMPEQMAVHWDVNNVPNTYMHKAFALFGIPVAMALIQTALLSLFYGFYIKKAKNMPKVTRIIIWCLPVINAITYAIILMWGLGYTLRVSTLVLLPLGAIVILLGNYLPKMSYEGNKDRIHPKPKDEKSFRKMLRITSIAFIIMGIAFILLGIFW